MRNKLLISMAILEIALQIGCGSSSSDNTDGPTENTQQLCDDTDCQKEPDSSLENPASPAQKPKPPVPESPLPGVPDPNAPANGGTATPSPYEITVQKLAASYCTAQPLADFEADDYQFLKTKRYLVTYFAGRPSLLVSVDGEWDEVSVDATKIEAKCDPSASRKVVVREAKVYASGDFNLPPVCVLPLAYEFGNNLSYTYSSESYATLSFDGMEQVCNGAATGYSPQQIVFFNLVKTVVQPPVVQPPVVQPPVVQPPVVQPPVVQPPVVQPPVVQPDCGNNFLVYYNTAYKYAYDSTGMNYPAEKARKFASLAAEKTCAYPQWLDSFKDARDYAYSYTGMNLNSSAAYDFAIIAASKETASKGWLAVFKDARDYAYSYTGMNLNSSAAYDFAIIAASKETASKGWLAVFKDARDYAYSYTGMNRNSSAAYDFALLAADKFVSKPNWFQKFKEAYTYAYSSSGLNLNASAAYDFALNAADR